MRPRVPLVRALAVGLVLALAGAARLASASVDPLDVRASVRQLLAMPTGWTNAGLDCDQSPYAESITIPTPGLYKIRVRAVGAFGDPGPGKLRPQLNVSCLSQRPSCPGWAVRGGQY